MGKPHIHAQNSVAHFGGKAKDYLKIHEFMDSSAVVFGDVRHRALTHNQWFIKTILVRIFGNTIKNSAGKKVSVAEIAEHHVIEDFGGKFIPAVADYLEEIELKPWMQNAKDGEVPPSRKKVKLAETIKIDESSLAKMPPGGVLPIEKKEFRMELPPRPDKSEPQKSVIPPEGLRLETNQKALREFHRNVATAKNHTRECGGSPGVID